MGRVPPTITTRSPSRHNPELVYTEVDTDGSVKTFYLEHPKGNRKMRRFRMRHHPYFTKSHTKGRAWMYQVDQ